MNVSIQNLSQVCHSEVVNLLRQMGAGPHRRPISMRLPHVSQLLVARPVGGHEDHLRVFGTRGAIGVPQHRREHSARGAPGSRNAKKCATWFRTTLTTITNGPRSTTLSRICREVQRTRIRMIRQPSWATLTKELPFWICTYLNLTSQLTLVIFKFYVDMTCDSSWIRVFSVH